MWLEKEVLGGVWDSFFCSIYLYIIHLLFIEKNVLYIYYLVVCVPSVAKLNLYRFIVLVSLTLDREMRRPYKYTSPNLLLSKLWRCACSPIFGEFVLRWMVWFFIVRQWYRFILECSVFRFTLALMHWVLFEEICQLFIGIGCRCFTNALIFIPFIFFDFFWFSFEVAFLSNTCCNFFSLHQQNSFYFFLI